MQDLNIQSLFQFLIPAIVSAISVILSLRHGLKEITEKVEKINIKLEKMDETQGITDKNVNLLSYRTEQLEEAIKELSDKVEEFEKDMRYIQKK